MTSALQVAQGDELAMATMEWMDGLVVMVVVERPTTTPSCVTELRLQVVVREA